MKSLYGLIAVTLVLALAACSEEKSEVQEAPPATEQGEKTGQAAPAKPAEGAAAPAAAPAEAPETTPGEDAQTPAEEKPQAAAPQEPSGSKTESACLKAVAEQTGESDVAVLSSEYSEANSLVMVGVGPNRAPWRCLVSNDGVVAEITSQTDEGAL